MRWAVSQRKNLVNKFVKLATAVVVAAMLVACGGGGGGDATPAAVTTTLSATQQNFETAALNGNYWVRYDWFMPSTNVAPTTGTNFFYTDNFAAPSSPANGAVTQTQTSVNQTATLAMPTLSQRYVYRILKSGVIYLSNNTTKSEWSYVGNDVLSTQFASDGITKLDTLVYDSWSAPIPLSGQIGNATILKSFLSFTKLTSQTVNYDFTKSWLPGSTYFTRKGYQKDDTLYLRDWSGTTYTTAVTPWSGAETTLETMFNNNTAIVTAGGVTVDGVLYPFSAGTITTLQSARAWVANAKRPTSASATDEYVTFIELNGKIYYGFLEKAGTRFNSIDGVDAIIVNDYNIRLNSTAATSMKQAFKF